MRYDNVIRGTFLDRPNRFIAHVQIGGKTETVHVKNTGRCRELLVEGAEVWLEQSANPARKTKYDLIAARKSSGPLVNIDSQAPNKVAREWLETQSFDKIVPEYTYGDSRIDFYMEKGREKYLMEVKGCTLEIDGIGYFPDAPTERGVKHLRELARATKEGYHAAVAFVIQMDGVTEVRPNTATHPEFGAALAEAQEEGVEVLFLLCHVEPDSLTVQKMIRIIKERPFAPQSRRRT
ncbi:MAG: DNA/RNA nuclease SfsA [Oscillospiraceae bacterium]|nr:DNA/RNA nuclease SfsA [Oscillospiraceae bacterium]